MGRHRASPIDLPPERRHSLVATLTVAAACLPLTQYVQWQVSAFVMLILLLRLAALRWPGALPGRGLLLLLTALGIMNCVMAHHSLLGKTGGSALLITMLALKLLELRGRRDHRIVAIAVSVLVVVQFLFAQGPGLTLFLAVVVVASVALLVDLNGGLGAAPVRQTLTVTARLAAQSFPLTLVLFLLFPRLDAPLWSLGWDRDLGVMGLSETMEPGAIVELVVNGDLAFRARFEQLPAPPPEQLYWRGLVLWDVDDRRWTPGRQAGGSKVPPRLLEADEVVRYEVVLEPSLHRRLFALDLPVDYPADTLIDASFQLFGTGDSTRNQRYRAASALRYRSVEASPAERRDALRLPPTVTARQRALAAQWAAEADSDWGLVQAALGYFGREDFHYTLLPPRLGENVWDEFLFETRSGYCEHFAGSFAVMMRLAGIPARVVLGYLGGEPNRIGGHLMIWQSDAHAWAEVLIAGRGWVRVDPTTAVATSRIDRQGADRLLGAEAPARFHIHASGLLPRFLRQVRDLADSVDAAWQDWVLDFAAQQQLDLLERMGLRAYGQWALVALMLTAAGVVTGLILLALVRERETPDRCTLAYGEFCRRLAKVGLMRAPSEGASDFGRRVVSARPDLTLEVERITDLYVRHRYGPTPDAEDGERLRHAVRGFHPSNPKGRGLPAGWTQRVLSRLFTNTKGRKNTPQ